ncbi:hypothetical protein OK349_03845 [Sphingomonas sp. BT-65]|uniref:hypothetical protein n=1 Tax=Sphingomonas sp. BT-65 TaxID=2989821 RepID=UPI002236804F|nr:hypothetical protein [Sphingomonas sp. BT-65]MCW4460826.1 hypothetical protein [Sphingomonas sp. BT-65]
MWNFNPLGKWSVASNPKHDEFFVDENRDIAQSLVREVSQNSGDAARKGVDAVRLKFRFGEIDRDVFHNHYLKGLRVHLEACDEAAASTLDATGAVPFLAIEDFGTSGLLGAYDSDDDDDSGFIRFWKRYGDSGKGGVSGGRHGVGKSTIAAGSQLRFVFGVTRRSDDGEKLLYGQAALKFHRIPGDEAHYDAYGLFSPANLDEWPRPFQGDEADTFIADFDLARDDEPGLSVVVPFPSKALTAEKLVAAAIEHCFHQILSGRLIVEVDDVVLDRDTIAAAAAASLPQLSAAVELSRIVTSDQPPPLIKPAASSIKAGLAASDFDEEGLAAIRKAWADNEIVAVELPIPVRPTGEAEQIGTVKLYLRRAGSAEDARETYVRGRVSVPETPKIIGKSAVALLVADEGAASRILGDSEGPAHARWIADRVKNSYKGAGDVLRTVRMALRDLHQIAAHAEGPAAIKDALKDFFWTRKPPEKEKKDEDKDDKKKIDIDKKGGESFELARIAGGFTVKRTAVGGGALAAKVAVAYDRRRGKPRWSPDDFDLTKGGIAIEAEGDGAFAAEPGGLIIEQAKPGFQVKVTGFLPSRDLFVEVDIDEEEGAHAA